MYKLLIINALFLVLAAQTSNVDVIINSCDDADNSTKIISKADDEHAKAVAEGDTEAANAQLIIVESHCKAYAQMPTLTCQFGIGEAKEYNSAMGADFCYTLLAKLKARGNQSQ